METDIVGSVPVKLRICNRQRLHIQGVDAVTRGIGDLHTAQPEAGHVLRLDADAVGIDFHQPQLHGSRILEEHAGRCPLDRAARTGRRTACAVDEERSWSRNELQSYRPAAAGNALQVHIDRRVLDIDGRSVGGLNRSAGRAVCRRCS